MKEKAAHLAEQSAAAEKEKAANLKAAKEIAAREAAQKERDLRAAKEKKEEEKAAKLRAERAEREKAAPAPLSITDLLEITEGDQSNYIACWAGRTKSYVDKTLIEFLQQCKKDGKSISQCPMTSC